MALPRIGIALSSGGAAAMAEAGVLEELAAAGLEAACVAGTSGGAIVGAAFCAGRLAGLSAAMGSLTRRRVLALFDPVWPRLGMLEGRRAMEFVRPYLGERIEELPRPFAAVATDLDTGRDVALREGDVFAAVRASIAIPGIMTPWRIGERMFVDGGLSNPIPVSVVREMGADFVVAINVLPLAATLLRARRRRRRRREITALAAQVLGRFSGAFHEQQASPPADAAPTPGNGSPVALSASERRGLVDVILRAGHIAHCQIAAMRLREEPPDFLITVPVPSMGIFEFHRTEELVKTGRAAAREALPALRTAVERARPPRERLRRWLQGRRATSPGQKAQV